MLNRLTSSVEVIHLYLTFLPPIHIIFLNHSKTYETPIIIDEVRLMNVFTKIYTITIMIIIIGTIAK